MGLDKIIDTRHCVRNFKETKKPSYKDIIKAIDAAIRAPRAGDLPTLRFILVLDKEKIRELAKAAQQDFIAKAHYIVVICSDKSLLEKYYYARAEKYAKQQAGAAIENFLLKITDLGLSSCWIGAFSDETVKRVLGIPDGIDVEALLPVGYEVKGKKEQEGKNYVKTKLDYVLFFDKYNNKFMKPERAPEVQ